MKPRRSLLMGTVGLGAIGLGLACGGVAPTARVAPEPSANADCSTFAGFVVPVEGGAVQRCTPAGRTLGITHADADPGDDPKGAAEALIGRYAARAAEAGWSRVTGDPNFVYAHPALDGVQLRIAAHGAMEGPGMDVLLATSPAR